MWTLTLSLPQVYSWGFGDMGQLGHKPGKGQEPKDEHRPRSIDFSKVGVNSIEIIKVSRGAGNDSSSDGTTGVH